MAEEKARKAVGAAAVAGATAGAGLLISQIVKKPSPPPTPPPTPPVSEVTIDDVYRLLREISAKMDVVSDKITQLIEKLTISLPEELKVEGKYQFMVVKEKYQTKAGEQIGFHLPLPFNKFALYIWVDGATDISLMVSPDSGGHMFDVGLVKSFPGEGSDAFLIEYVCNYVEVKTSNAVKITIAVAGIT